LPLEFLGDGNFEATIYQDMSDDGEKPNELHEVKRFVDVGAKLEASLASGGGVAAIFRPVE
jgi:hypothetical protein